MQERLASPMGRRRMLGPAAASFLSTDVCLQRCPWGGCEAVWPCINGGRPPPRKQRSSLRSARDIATAPGRRWRRSSLGTRRRSLRGDCSVRPLRQRWCWRVPGVHVPPPARLTYTKMVIQEIVDTINETLEIPNFFKKCLALRFGFSYLSKYNIC